MRDNTSDLVVMAKAGDNEAFSQLYAQFHQSIIGQLISMGFCLQEAEDLCHDIFLQAYLKLNQLKDTKSFASWLRTSTRRAGINYFLRERRYLSLIGDPIDARADTSVSKRIEKKEKRQIVRKASELLKPTDRDAIKSFYFDGLSVKDMAIAYDAPIGTIKRRLHVARRRLGDILLGVSF